MFLGYLYRVLRRAEHRDGWAAAAAFGAGVVTAAVKLGSITPVIAAQYSAAELSPDLARTLDDLGSAAFVVSGYTSGIFVGLAAASAFFSGVLPRWVTVPGLVIGVLTVAAGIAGALNPAGYVPVPFMLGLAWVLVTSVLLTMRGSRSPVDRDTDGVPAEVRATA
jgi:hypothetical protein